jgi:serine/threonine-protein kinase
VLEERYRVVGELGSGGMGVVYRAEHLRLRRHVAIKMLRQPFSGAQDLRPRFEREARALAALSHPNVVIVTDYGVHAGRPFLAMELVEGRTLRTIVDEGLTDVDRAVDIARQLLEGVAFAHHCGLVHRDIKPSNVLLSPLEGGRELVKILDFGFAKFVEGESEHGTITRSAIGFGTPAYIPPEQATGGTTDARTDVYSLGVVLFELLTGKQPFEGEMAELIHKHLVEPVPRIADARPGISFAPELQDIIDRAMAKKKDDRFDDASMMLAALRAVNDPSGLAELPPGVLDAPIQARAPTARPASVSGSQLSLPALREVYRQKRGGGLPWLLAIAMLAAIGVGVYLAWPGEVEEHTNAVTAAAASAAREAGERIRHRQVAGAAAEQAAEGTEEQAGEVAEGADDTAAEGAGGEAAAEHVAAASADEGAEATQDDVAAPADAVAAEGTGAEAEVEPDQSAVARDPWATAPVPRELARLRRRVYGRGQVTDAILRQLRQYARDNRADARPSLLLGEAYMRKGWSQDALERYELAYSISADARHDARMLRNLVRIVAEVPGLAPRTSDDIKRMYGAEAREAIDAALGSRTLDDEAIRRLRTLRRQLPRR